MEALRKLFISLGLDWDSAGFAQAQVAVDLLEGGLAAVVAVGKEVVDVLKSATLETARYADDLQDASIRTGASVAALQELGFAAEQSGASAETINHALTRLAMTMGEASKGGSEAGKAFSALGVKVTDADGKLRRTDEVFTDLARSVAAIDNPTERSAKALDVFGRAGIQLLPLLNEGADGLEALREEARSLGLVMADDAVKPAATFNDVLDALRATMKSLERDLGGPLIEALLPIAEGLKEWVKQNRALIRTGITTFARGLVTVVKGLASAVGWLVENWKLIAIIATSVLLPVLWSIKAVLLEQLVAFGLNAAAAVAYGATQVAAGLAAAAAWTAANAPLLLSIALLAALLLGAEDVYSFLTGADSLIGDLGPKWTRFLDEWTRDVTGDDHPVIVALKAMVYYLSDIEGRLLPLLKNSWASAILQPLTAALELVFKLFRGTAGVADLLRAIPGVGLVGGEFFSGGAASVESGARRSTAAAPQALAPSFAGSFTINAQPGQSAQEVAGATRETLEEWFDSKLRTLGGAF